MVQRRKRKLLRRKLQRPGRKLLDPVPATCCRWSRYASESFASHASIVIENLNATLRACFSRKFYYLLLSSQCHGSQETQAKVSIVEKSGDARPVSPERPAHFLKGTLQGCYETFACLKTRVPETRRLSEHQGHHKTCISRCPEKC